MTKIPKKYVPSDLNEKDKKKQIKEIKKSREEYKKGNYYKRDKVESFHTKLSSHIKDAQKIYQIEKISISEELSKKTGCNISALKKILQKGEGAYYSSGSRPNQTAQSWGYARLASAITGGKAAAIDFSIIEKGCDHNGKAYKLAIKSLERNKKITSFKK